MVHFVCFMLRVKEFYGIKRIKDNFQLFYILTPTKAMSPNFDYKSAS